jgi:hypothetical protein
VAFSRSFEPVPLQIQLGALSVTATRSFGGLIPGSYWFLKALELTDAQAIVGDAANRWTITVNKGTPAAPVAIVSYDMIAGQSLVAHTPKSIPLGSVSEALRTLAPSDILHAVVQKQGTAPNFVAGVLTCWLTSVVDKAAAAA